MRCSLLALASAKARPMRAPALPRVSAFVRPAPAAAAPSRDRAQECQTNTEWNMEQASRRVRQPHQLDSVVINVGSANNDDGTVGDSD